jgi:predicted MPP superfamily phosphohydrolase
MIVMNLKNLSRRKFLTALGAVFVGTPLVVAADAKWMEPTWLKVRRLRIGTGKPTHRFVHFTDLHHKGDRKYLQTVINVINSLAPDFVCFTGDIVEEQKYLPEALEMLAQIKSPMFGASCSHANQALLPLNPSEKNILLFYYPVWAKKLGDQKYDLMLAGHSHGGQSIPHGESMATGLDGSNSGVVDCDTAHADAKSKDIKARLRPAGGTFAGDDVKQSQSFE